MIGPVDHIVGRVAGEGVYSAVAIFTGAALGVKFLLVVGAVNIKPAFIFDRGRVAEEHVGGDGVVVAHGLVGFSQLA